MKTTAILLALAAILACGWTYRLETSYSKAWATEHAGTPEYRLTDGTRVDVLTDAQAVEFEYPKKWAESLGQALYYASQTGRQPAIVYIVGSPKDQRYIDRARATVEYWHLPVEIMTVPR